jgi:hypothetical protein
MLPGKGLVATSASLHTSGVVESQSPMNPGPCMMPRCTRPSSLTVPVKVHVVSDSSIHEIVKLILRPWMSPPWTNPRTARPRHFR